VMMMMVVEHPKFLGITAPVHWLKST
jgi:hypothetical protein